MATSHALSALLCAVLCVLAHGCATLPGAQESASEQDPALAPAQGAEPPQEPRGSMNGDDLSMEEGEGGGAAHVEPPARRSGPPVRGTLSTRLWARGTGDDTDLDLSGYLDLDVGDPEEDELTGRFAGRVHLDADSHDGDAFDGLDDTFGGDLRPRVYDAYVDWHGEGPVELVRLGRQSDFETPELLVYDGVRVESRELGGRGLRLGAYGGVGARHYESPGDALVGAYVEGRPWSGGRGRLDWIHADDDRSSGEDLLGVALWQTLARRLRLQGAYSHLSGDPRDVDLRATWYDPEADLLVRGTYYRLLETQRANPLEFDTFFETLFEWFPFHRVGLTAAKGLSEHVRVEGGLDLREVEDGDDEGRFNRDVQRYFLTTTLDDLLWEDGTLSVTGDLWDSDAQETYSLGLDLSHEFSAALRASLGTHYAVYDFDPLLVAEREDVRTYYVAARWEASEALGVDVGYDYEDAEIDDFHTLRLGLSWRF